MLFRVVLPHATLQQTPATTPACGSATPTQSAAADLTPAHGQNLQPIFEQEDEDLEDEQEAVEHLSLKQMIQQDHLVDNILGSL